MEINRSRSSIGDYEELALRGQEFDGLKAMENFLYTTCHVSGSSRYEEIHQAVRHSLRQEEGGWLAEAADVATGLGLDTPVDELIASFLLDYETAQHIIIEDAKIEDMRQAEDKWKDDHDSNRKPTSLGYPTKNEELNEFLARHEGFCENMSENVRVYDSNQVYQSDKMHDLTSEIESLDNMLGIAGYRFNADQIDGQSPEAGVRNLFRDHVMITLTDSGYRADIGLGHFSSQNSDLQYVVQVMAMYTRLEQVVRRLRSTGQLGDELLYFRRRRFTPDNNQPVMQLGPEIHEKKNAYIESVSLNIETINGLFNTMQKFYQDIMAVNSSIRASLSIPLLATLLGGPILGSIGLIATAVYYLFQQSATSSIKAIMDKWKHIPEEAQRSAISTLATSAMPILDGFQLFRQHNAGAAPPELAPDIPAQLHSIAVAGQFISVLLQSHARRFRGPLDFEDVVDCPVSHFRFTGTDLNQPPLYAFTQRLDGVLDQQILVVDTEDANIWPMELRLTLSEAMMLWQPVKLVVSQTPGSEGGLSCLGLATMGGVIVPEDMSKAGSCLWHWRELTPEIVPYFESLGTQGKVIPTIGLHSKIRLGVCRDPNAKNWQEYLDTYEESRSQDMEMAAREEDPSSEVCSSMQVVDTDEQVTYSEDSPQTSSSASQGVEDNSGRTSPHIDEGDQAVTICGDQAVTICAWECRDSDEYRRREMRNFELSGTEVSRFSRDSIQWQAGIQHPAVPLSLQILDTWKLNGKQTRRGMLQKNIGLVDFLNQESCLFVSLHAGIIQRVRMRDMVAYWISSMLTGKIADTPSLDEAVPMLRSNENVNEWIRKRSGIGKALEEGVESVVKMICRSGISPKKDLVAIWPGSDFSQFTIERRLEKWIQVLTDSSNLTTFACIVPHCLQTPEYPCEMAKAAGQTQPEWHKPTLFRLKTKVAVYRKPKHMDTDLTQPRQGAAYWMNDPKLGMLARVIGSTTLTSGSGEIFYLSVNRRRLPAFFYRGKYAQIVEKDIKGSWDCVVSSGKSFESQVYDYIST